MIQPRQASGEDVRIKATTRIWTFATIMLGLCVPFMVRASSLGYFVVGVAAIVPVCVIAAAAFGTVAVWGAFGKSRIMPSPNELQQLEVRMAHLELIHHYENALQSEKEINSRLRAQRASETASEEQEPRRMTML